METKDSHQNTSKVNFCHDFLFVQIFLYYKGKCVDANCLKSHEAYHIPHCLFYPKGPCNGTNCPYLHVKINPDAPNCQLFKVGKCIQGKECTFKHNYVQFEKIYLYYVLWAFNLGSGAEVKQPDLKISEYASTFVPKIFLE